MAWLFLGRSIINRESDGSSKLAHNAVRLWRSRWYRGKKRYLCQLILDFNTGMGDGLVGNEESDLGGT